ncbi:hypothetical protein LPJ38_32375 [Bradyrhizobium daqingense]|uniref:Uncharacterized protein n=1 Tax=Bradyrhizobium daqingense TaxID=993502 RepID=A0A562LQS2_9BRAD|nr:hypothetical protein [Bradyrhizobium daqingense]TWI09975.1 hypothetical protein IQ17_01055 [Bradyrhizobium daqingense]UFS88285.1 hypothetical protein LPJ38_32375 [Bradyrhizobium daqingense]
MPGHDTYTRTRNIHDEIAAIARQTAYVRDLIAQSCEILKQPLPDTFLGRKTHEPFPITLGPSPERER